jgi:hypothetical protein
MKRTLLVYSLLLALSCNDSNQNDMITGAYARQYSFEQTNIQTGKVLGTSTIRDTFYIQPEGEGYRVTEKKWRNNDYDLKGWVQQLHSTDRQRSPYVASFDPALQALNSREGTYPPIYLDTKAGVLFLGQSEQNPYNKVTGK